jgi:hypothetical protein
MRKWLIGIGITLLAAALGVGAAYGGSVLLKNRPQPVQTAAEAEIAGGQIIPQQRMMPRQWKQQTAPDGRYNGPADRFGSRDAQSAAATPITADQAVQQAEAVAARISPDLQLAQMTEYQNDFYAVFAEKAGGRGALEVLVDRYGRGVTLAPTMMWNLKYGASMHRNAGGATDNSVTVDDARASAQKFLDAALPGATIQEGGTAFYGYYTFAYSVDGKTAGLVSVNGLTGRVGLQTWHGDFVSDVEAAK